MNDYNYFINLYLKARALCRIAANKSIEEVEANKIRLQTALEQLQQTPVTSVMPDLNINKNVVVGQSQQFKSLNIVIVLECVYACFFTHL